MEQYVRTQIVITIFADATVETRDAGLDGHSVARFQVFDVSADFNDGSAGLVTQHHRFGDHPFVYIAVDPKVDIRSTQTDCRKPSNDYYAI